MSSSSIVGSVIEFEEKTPAGGSRSPISSSKSKSKSLWRRWKRLSRFQRSLVYMILVIIFFSGLYLYVQTRLKTKTKTKVEVIQGGEELVATTKKSYQLQIEKVRNKVELVHKMVNGDEKLNEAENLANEEEEEEDFDHHQSNEDEDDKKDSNQAKETFDPKGLTTFKGPQNERQKAVVSAFKHAWKGYKTYAWGHDHLKPISKTKMNWFGLGMTIVDGIDTMIIMNLMTEFEECRDWIAHKLHFGIRKDVNLFETTIRLLGGLLSTFHLSADKIFLTKAKDLGDRLIGAFNSPSGIPYSDVNLASSRGHVPKWNPDSSTSEATTIQLEFRDLSRSTGDSAFEDAAAAVSAKVHKLPKLDGLVPIFISAQSGEFRKSSPITLGARGDSYYEYLIKQWIQTGKTVDYLKKDYVEAIAGIEKRLARRTVPNNLLYIGELQFSGKGFKPKMDELACFLPGTLALGVHHGMPQSHMKLAEELAYTCYQTFARHPTHLAPEITYFNSDLNAKNDFYVKANDAHYLLRPETIESLWYLYYFTGNKMYQDWGWKIFQGIEKYTKVANGYTTIGNVQNALDLKPRDLMESYFLAETLKYLYLLFADEHEIDLDKWVFNTEGHPLPVLKN